MTIGCRGYDRGPGGGSRLELPLPNYWRKFCGFGPEEDLILLLMLEPMTESNDDPRTDHKQSEAGLKEQDRQNEGKKEDENEENYSSVTGSSVSHSWLYSCKGLHR